MKIPANILLVVILLSCLTACGQSIPPQIRLELVADGFTSPVALIDPADGSGRLFVVDQIGLIWILSNGERIERPSPSIILAIVAAAMLLVGAGLAIRRRTISHPTT